MLLSELKFLRCPSSFSPISSRITLQQTVVSIQRKEDEAMTFLVRMGAVKGSAGLSLET